MRGNRAHKNITKDVRVQEILTGWWTIIQTSNTSTNRSRSSVIASQGCLITVCRTKTMLTKCISRWMFRSSTQSRPRDSNSRETQVRLGIWTISMESTPSVLRERFKIRNKTRTLLIAAHWPELSCREHVKMRQPGFSKSFTKLLASVVGLQREVQGRSNTTSLLCSTFTRKFPNTTSTERTLTSDKLGQRNKTVGLKMQKQREKC